LQKKGLFAAIIGELICKVLTFMIAETRESKR